MPDVIDDVFDKIGVAEKELKKKYPKQKGRVILANIKQEIDYEFGKPEGDMEVLKWANTYLSRLKEALG